MKDLYYVKWDCVIPKGIQKYGVIEHEVKNEEVYHYGKAVFAENEKEAISNVTKGWRNVVVKQVRKYQEIERKDF